MSTSKHVFVLNPAGDMQLGKRMHKAITSDATCKELKAEIERVSAIRKKEIKVRNDLERRVYRLARTPGIDHSQLEALEARVHSIENELYRLYDEKQELKRKFKNAKCVRKYAFSNLWKLFM